MTTRVVLGKFQDGGYGMRCSSGGYNANSNPVDQFKLSFSTDWTAMAPIYLSGSWGSIGNGSTINISFPTLYYIPFTYLMWTHTGSGEWYTSLQTYFDLNPYLVMDTYQDHIKIINNTGNTIDVIYAIYKMQAY